MKDKIKAIIFDMDGVLFDSEPIHAKSWQTVLKSYGHKYSISWFDPWIGIPDGKLTEFLVNTHKLNITSKELANKKRLQHREYVKTILKPFSGVDDALKKLKLLKIPFTLATSTLNKEARIALKATGLSGYFKTIIGGDDVKKHKPHPMPYLHASKLINVKPKECIAIEDSTAGIASAKKAGCKVFAVTTSFEKEKLKEADEIFSSTKLALKKAFEVLNTPYSPVGGLKQKEKNKVAKFNLTPIPKRYRPSPMRRGLKKRKGKFKTVKILIYKSPLRGLGVIINKT